MAGERTAAVVALTEDCHMGLCYIMGSVCKHGQYQNGLNPLGTEFKKKKFKLKNK